MQNICKIYVIYICNVKNMYLHKNDIIKENKYITNII